MKMPKRIYRSKVVFHVKDLKSKIKTKFAYKVPLKLSCQRRKRNPNWNPKTQMNL